MPRRTRADGPEVDVRADDPPAASKAASSSRSKLLLAGRWRDHPRCSWEIHHVWVVEYETPVVVSITFATRASVQSSVGKPFLRAPFDVCKLSNGQQGPAPGTPGAGEDLEPTLPKGR